MLWVTTADSPLVDDDLAVQVVTRDASPRLREKLTGQASFDYLDQPLTEVLDDIMFTYDVTIDRSLNDPDAPISQNQKGIALRSALGALLHLYGLRCEAQGDKLVVTDAPTPSAQRQGNVE